MQPVLQMCAHILLVLAAALSRSTHTEGVTDANSEHYNKSQDRKKRELNICGLQNTER